MTDSTQSKIIVNPPTRTRPVGFNHAILVTGGRLLFLAGQTAGDREGRIVAPGDLVAQYEQVLHNLQEIVAAAGGQMTDIVKMNMYVRSRDDYAARRQELGRVHRAFFGTYYPATALFEVARLLDDQALIEIEGIAVLAPDPGEGG